MAIIKTKMVALKQRAKFKLIHALRVREYPFRRFPVRRTPRRQQDCRRGDAVERRSSLAGARLTVSAVAEQADANGKND